MTSQERDYTRLYCLMMQHSYLTRNPNLNSNVGLLNSVTGNAQLIVTFKYGEV